MMSCSLFLFRCLLCSFLGWLTICQADEFSLLGPATTFGGNEATFRIEWGMGEIPHSCLVQWQLSRENRTLRRGEFEWRRQTAPSPAWSVALPEVPKVPLRTVMSVKVSPESRQVEHPVWVMPTDPFLQWSAKEAASWRVHVYDPDGFFAGRLAGMSLPVENVQRLSVLQGAGTGVLVLAPGLDCVAHRTMGTMLAELAASGWRVILPEPISGIWTGPDANKTVAFELRSKAVVQELDKRLCVGDLLVAKHGIGMEARRGTVQCAVSEDGGYSWLRLEYPGGGELICCTLSIGSSWEATPVARYLLAHMIAYGAKSVPGQHVSGQARQD